MKLSVFRKLVHELRRLEDERSAYVDTIPKDLEFSVIDNTYSNLTGIMFDKTVDVLLGNMSEDFHYFLYESFPQVAIVNDVRYEINNTDDYIKYAQAVFSFDPE